MLCTLNCSLGKVYKGVLHNNQSVAIKQITDEGYIETFTRELKSLSKVRHPNLVALLGYCKHKDECFLLYELCPNGNLSEWIFGNDFLCYVCLQFLIPSRDLVLMIVLLHNMTGKDKHLPWIHRLKIAIHCARGLRFLHNYSKGCIVHRDIKVCGHCIQPC